MSMRSPHAFDSDCSSRHALSAHSFEIILTAATGEEEEAAAAAADACMLQQLRNAFRTSKVPPLTFTPLFIFTEILFSIRPSLVRKA
jgi:hypothetical protein